MRLRFTKMQGLGNDFVVLDGIAQRVALAPAALRRIADRHFGVGCDQILVVERARAPGVDFRYRIFNGDGGEVEQCGNGARCFVRFVRDRGLTDKREIRVETLSGIIAPTSLTVGVFAVLLRTMRLGSKNPANRTCFALLIGPVGYVIYGIIANLTLSVGYVNCWAVIVSCLLALATSADSLTPSTNWLASAAAGLRPSPSRPRLAGARHVPQGLRRSAGGEKRLAHPRVRCLQPSSADETANQKRVGARTLPRRPSALAARGRRVARDGAGGAQRRRSSATACAARPSPRPVKPRRLVVVARTLTCSPSTPSAPASRSRIAAR